MFSLTGGGKYNFLGTKRWIEENLDHAGEFLAFVTHRPCGMCCVYANMNLNTNWFIWAKHFLSRVQPAPWQCGICSVFGYTGQRWWTVHACIPPSQTRHSHAHFYARLGAGTYILLLDTKIWTSLISLKENLLLCFWYLLQVVSSRFPWVKVGLVHKKINLVESTVAWEHERYSLRRIPGFTLSHLEDPKSELRGSILDTL